MLCCWHEESLGLSCLHLMVPPAQTQTQPSPSNAPWKLLSWWQILWKHHRADKLNRAKKCKHRVWMLNLKTELSSPSVIYPFSSKSSAPAGVMLEGSNAKISLQKDPFVQALTASPEDTSWGLHLALASAAGQAQTLGRSGLFGAAEQPSSTMGSTEDCQMAAGGSRRFGCSQVSQFSARMILCQEDLVGKSSWGFKWQEHHLFLSFQVPICTS